MSDPVSGLVAGGGILGGILGSNNEREAAKDASSAQVAATKMGIEETRRQFDKIQELLAPYNTAGTSAIGAQQDLLGLKGGASQSAAINALQSSPMFQSLVKSGETSILQNASASGGLRGGNVQSTLAQFRPQMLDQLIQRQFSNLGSLTGIGQASAAGTAAAAQNTGAQVSSLLQDQGAARAGYSLARGQSRNNLMNTILQGAGLALGAF